MKNKVRMINNVLLSVIIPIYNVEAYLQQCLDSVLVDNQFTGEVICVNDGSTDNSFAICSEYSKRYSNIKVISQPNKGLSAARNIGITNAIGKYVYFLDADDYRLPDAINNIVNAIEAGKSEVICTNVLCNESSPLLPFHLKISKCTGSDFLTNCYKQVGYSYPVQAWLYVCKRSFLQENKLFFKEGFFHEDEDFTPRLLMAVSEIELLNVPCQYHRTHRPNSITSKITNKHISDLVVIARDLTFALRKNCYENERMHSAIFQIYMNAIFRAEKYHISLNGTFLSSDIHNLKWLANTIQEKRAACLAGISLSLSSKYYNEDLPVFLRRLLNLLFYRV